MSEITTGSLMTPVSLQLAAHDSSSHKSGSPYAIISSTQTLITHCSLPVVISHLTPYPVRSWQRPSSRNVLQLIYQSVVSCSRISYQCNMICFASQYCRQNNAFVTACINALIAIALCSLVMSTYCSNLLLRYCSVVQWLGNLGST